MYVGARTLGQVAGKRGTPVIILSAQRAQVSGATGGPTATGVFVSPQTLKYSPSAAKAFVAFSCTGTTPIVKSSFNVSTVTRGAAGVFKVTYTSALNTGYAVVVSLKASNAGKIGRASCRERGEAPV